jgi:nitrite reductase/ring-hydroxylating ferredoxin subunit
MDRARIVAARGHERIAVFRHKDGFSAVTNVCAHEGGPLGEGNVIDGCITCPWHGWQYKASDGCSPPPFTEKIATHAVRITRGRVEVSIVAQPPGTALPPARAGAEEDRHG